MSLDGYIRLLAGFLLLLITIFKFFPMEDLHWFWKALFLVLSFHQIQMAFTGWCSTLLINRLFSRKDTQC